MLLWPTMRMAQAHVFRDNWYKKLAHRMGLGNRHQHITMLCLSYKHTCASNLLELSISWFGYVAHLTQAILSCQNHGICSNDAFPKTEFQWLLKWNQNAALHDFASQCPVPAFGPCLHASSQTGMSTHFALLNSAGAWRNCGSRCCNPSKARCKAKRVWETSYQTW